MRTVKAAMIGFWLGVGWTLGQWLMSIAIPYWVSKIQPLVTVKGIPF